MERARTAAEIVEQAQEQRALLGSGRTDAAAKVRLHRHGVERCSAELFKIAEGRHPPTGTPAQGGWSASFQGAGPPNILLMTSSP
jgi:hypothetical protein